MLEKIIKNAKNFDKVVNICIILFVIFVVLSFTILTKLINADSSEFIIGQTVKEQSLEVSNWYAMVGDSQLDISFLNEQSDIKTAVIISQIVTIFGVLVATIPLYALKMLLDTIICGIPFDGSVSKNIRLLGYGVMGFQIFSASSMGISQVLCNIFIESYHRGVLFQIKPEIVFTFVLYSTLASIFAYGEELQTQVDETL